jgi:hypothetical protein
MLGGRASPQKVFFGGLECVGHSFAYVAPYLFLRDVWIRTQIAAVASRRATNFAPISPKLSHPSPSKSCNNQKAACGVAQSWCGVARAAWLSHGAAWLSMVRRGSVGSASACCKAGTTGRFFPTEQTSDEEMKRGLSEWRWINVLYECD